MPAFTRLIQKTDSAKPEAGGREQTTNCNFLAIHNECGKPSYDHSFNLWNALKLKEKLTLLFLARVTTLIKTAAECKCVIHLKIRTWNV